MLTTDFCQYPDASLAISRPSLLGYLGRYGTEPLRLAWDSGEWRQLTFPPRESVVYTRPACTHCFATSSKLSQRYR